MSALIVQSAAKMAFANGRGLVDKDSQEPTAERAFTIEGWWIVRRGEPTVLYGKFGSFGSPKDAARYEVELPATA